MLELTGKKALLTDTAAFAVIDLFSGAGGVTTGIEMAELNGRKVAEVICAINHDRKAIESHWANHPHVKHFVEDIRTFNVRNLPRTEKPGQFKLLWASLECTNHSNAKGGLSRDADSRTLAEHLPPYIREFQPDYIGIENVREFREWGPLMQKCDASGVPMVDKKGKPVMVPDPAQKCIDYRRWVKEICSLGYRHEERILNSADFGAHTSRRRLFILFAREGMPIVWPEPTHSRTGEDGKAKWRPVKECLDFENKGKSIFARKKPLSDNTFKRIYAGLVKFIAGGDESFIAQYNGAGFDDRVNSAEEPSKTITTSNRFAVVQPAFLTKYYGTGKNIAGIDEAAPTLTTKDRLAVIQPQRFLAKYNSSHNNTQQNAGASIDQPGPTITARPGVGLVTAEQILFNPQYHSAGSDVEKPAFTLIARMDKRPPGLLSVERFVAMNYTSGKTSSGIESPADAVTTVPKHNLVSVFVMNTNYGNIGAGLDDALFSLVSSRRHPYLVQLVTGELAIAVEKSDSEIVRKVKMFMAAYGIIDIYMRMLTVKELLKITGLPEDYVLEGTQADRKKFIGNAVPPVLPKVMLEALAGHLKSTKLKEVA